MKNDRGDRNKPAAGRDRKIDYRRYTFSVRERLYCGLVAAALGIFVVWLCYRTWAAFPAGVAAGLFYLYQKKKSLREQRKQTLEMHFKSVLSSIHTSMLAGYSLENAVKAAEKDCRELFGVRDCMAIEMKEMVWQMECQRPVENLFWELGLRSGISSILTFGEVLIIAKRTGGSMQKVLEDTWRNLSEKIETSQEIASMIAAKKYEQKLMSVMPAAILLYLRFTFREFLDPLYGNSAGILVMSAALGVYLLAYLWGKKIVYAAEIGNL